MGGSRICNLGGSEEDHETLCFGAKGEEFTKECLLPNRLWERKKEGLTSVSPSRDNVGDALSTQKETNYASHAESPNRDPEESHTRWRVKIQNTDRGRGRWGLG